MILNLHGIIKDTTFVKEAKNKNKYKPSKNNNMNTIAEVKAYFSQKGTKSVANEVADYQFVKREKDNVMFQFSNCEFKFYKTFDGFCKAVLWRLKRG